MHVHTCSIAEPRPRIKYGHTNSNIHRAQLLLRFFVCVPQLFQVFEMTLCDFGVGGGDMMFINAALYCPKLRSITFNWCNLSESAIVKGFRTFSRSIFTHMLRVHIRTVPIFCLCIQG